MIKRLINLARLRRDEQGSVVVETAIVLPVLALMALGGYEASQLIAREAELQSAIAEGADIVLATIPEDQDDLDAIELIIEASAGLPEGGVNLQQKFRCDATAALVDDISSCASDAVISEFIHLNVWDDYEPVWTSFGIGSTVRYSLRRRIQIS